MAVSETTSFGFISSERERCGSRRGKCGEQRKHGECGRKLHNAGSRCRVDRRLRSSLGGLRAKVVSNAWREVCMLDCGLLCILWRALGLGLSAHHGRLGKSYPSLFLIFVRVLRFLLFQSFKCHINRHDWEFYHLGSFPSSLVKLCTGSRPTTRRP
jgi:hypothetical protein